MEEHITTEEYAATVSRPVSTIYYWRAHGIGPTGFRVGKRILFRRSDVERWLADLHEQALSADSSDVTSMRSPELAS